MSVRIIFMGTPDFAVPALRALIDAPAWNHTYRDAAEFAIYMGIIKKRGSWYYLEGKEDDKKQGMVGMMEYLKEHQEELDKIKELCYNSLSKQSSIDDEELETEDFDE